MGVTSPVKYTGRPSSVALIGSNKLSYSPRTFSADHFDEEPCDRKQKNFKSAVVPPPNY